MHLFTNDFHKNNIINRLTKNPILKSFLEIGSNLKIFSEYLENPQPESKAYLESAFKDFYSEIRIINYISKIIYYSSIDFDKKHRAIQKKFQLVLDQPIFDHEKGQTTIKDTLLSEPQFETLNEQQNLEDSITDFSMYQAFSVLTSREKMILTLCFIHCFTDTEIAKKIKVTQQAVSKTKKNALKKLKLKLIEGC